MGGMFSNCCCGDTPTIPSIERVVSDVTLAAYPTLAGYEPNNEVSDYGGVIRRGQVAILPGDMVWRWIGGSLPNYVYCFDAARVNPNDYTGLGVWYNDRHGSFKTLGKMRIYYPAKGFVGIYNNADFNAGGDLLLSSSTPIEPSAGSPIEVFPDGLVAASGKHALSVAVFFFGIEDASDLPATIPHTFLLFNFP